jgi:hypothetical protein
MRGGIPALANTVGGMEFPVQGKDFQQGVVVGMINGQARTFANLETPSRTRSRMGYPSARSPAQRRGSVPCAGRPAASRRS